MLIGERINPTGKKRLAEALRAGDLSVVREEALAQVAAGADILDVNVGATGVDEVAMLPLAVKAVAEVVDVPLCIDSRKIEALAAALAVCPGRPIVNSVTGEEASLQTVLPLVKERGLPVIGLTLDEKGIPAEAEARVAIAHRIVERAEALGHPARGRDHRLPDPVAGRQRQGRSGHPGGDQESAGRAGRATRPRGRATSRMGCRTARCSTGAYLAMAIEAGLTCPTVDVALVRLAVLVGRPGAGPRQLRDAVHRGLPRGAGGGRAVGGGAGRPAVDLQAER